MVLWQAVWECKRKWKLSGQFRNKLWWSDLLVAYLWVILTSTLFWEVGEVFFLTDMGRRVFNEACVWASVCVKRTLKSISLCYVWCAMGCFEREDCLIDVLLFSPFVAFSLLSSAHHPTSISLFLFTATRQWRSGCQRCGGRGDDRVIPLSAFFSHWSVTCSLLALRCDTEKQFPRQSRCLFLWQGANDKAEVEYVFEGKQLFAFQIFFFTANLKVPFSCTATWTWQTVDAPGWTISVLTWKLRQPGLKRKKKKCPSVLASSFQKTCGTGRDEFAQRRVYSCIYCEKVQTIEFDLRATLTDSWDLCSSMQDPEHKWCVDHGG